MSEKSETQTKQKKRMACWLLLLAGLLFGMILLGGATRLTHSGLSIVDWKPIMGVIPPLSQADWQASFQRYKAFPEYQQVNHGMTLEAYKVIFAFEYLHRLLGRILGLLLILPLAIFWYQGSLNRALKLRILLIFALGGAQGFLGWYMVQSGLVNLPRVSPYRLSAHLMLAVLIYASLLWLAFGLLKSGQQPNTDAAKALYPLAQVLTGLIALMILSGGLMAGTHAGLAYNTFPQMSGHWIPPGMYTLQPSWLNWFENLTTIQFNHRLIATLLVLTLPLVCLAVWRRNLSPASRRSALLLLGMLILQIALGITTLLLHVPVTWALAHQGGAILLLTFSLYLTHQLQARPKSNLLQNATIRTTRAESPAQ